MHDQPIDSARAWPDEVIPSGGIWVLSGYGLTIRVWRGRLRVSDGIGHRRREVLIHRATGRLRRLVVLGHTGSVSLEAIRWLADVGAGYVQIDEDGRVLAAFGPQGTDRPGLRRAQARALDTPAGDAIVRALLGQKVAGQTETLKAVNDLVPIPDVAMRLLAAAATSLHVAVGRDELRTAEARAAAAYWSAWSAVPARFARRDAGQVPDNWRAFGARTSPLTASPRLAANPANAILNYLYALLEGEATIAARVVGLDPGVGILHADLPSRDSLSADLMEPVRPKVDAFVLDLLRTRPLAVSDFHETRQGVCRLTPALASDLAATLPRWRLEVGRVAEVVAQLLVGGGVAGSPTPITQRRRAAARPQGARAAKAAARIDAACSWCGGSVEPGRRTCSPECKAAVVADNRPAFVEAGRQSLARMRGAGSRVCLSEPARRRIGLATSESVREGRAWSRTHRWPADMAAFEREILPGLAGVTARAIADATGLSVGYCRRVIAGGVRPHPMWWAAMRAISDKRQITGGA